ncbi:hypothetical protein V5799_000498 [Amblyomma americanum]|uniref:Uncharacterized protein n=1 Tax=Amblyomma americanum TaxID=6943 RepID=A0AAQ4D2W1_AMBAM
MTRAVGDAFVKRLFRWSPFRNNIEVVANWSSLSRTFKGFEAVHDLTLGPAYMSNSFVMNWRRSTLPRVFGFGVLNASADMSAVLLWPKF